MQLGDLTEAECIALLQHATNLFPDHLGTSLVLALSRVRPIDDALLIAAAGPYAAAWRPLLPVEHAGAEQLHQLGWQSPARDPELVASLIHRGAGHAHGEQVGVGVVDG